jgi:hypothetical protein
MGAGELTVAFALRSLAFVAVVAALAVLWVLQCSGPEASIDGVELIEPESPGDPYRIVATIDTSGRGHGTITIRFTLSDGDRHFASERQVQVSEDDTVMVVEEIPAPQGDYEAGASVIYPPD